MARTPFPSSFDVNINNPVSVRRPLPNPTANRAQSSSQLQYSPAYLYHYVNWSSASGVGALNYVFFGGAVGNNGLTQEDTNLLQPNNVGAGNVFICEKIFVDLKLGEPFITNAANGTEITTNALSDYAAIMNRGYFQFNVNNVPQLGNGIAPLKYLATPTNILSNSAVSSGSGDTTGVMSQTPFASNSGYDCQLNPFSFNDQTSFAANISFPLGAVTLPSANNTTKIGVVLKGFWFRPAG